MATRDSRRADFGRDRDDWRTDERGRGRGYPGGFYTGESGRGTPYGFGYGSLDGAAHAPQTEQQYRGRGPRGYQRSDERIREDVCDCLTDDPEIDASNFDVTVNNGEVSLTGTIDSYDNKRRATDLIEDFSGVKDVHNNLRVRAAQDAERRSR